MVRPWLYWPHRFVRLVNSSYRNIVVSPYSCFLLLVPMFNSLCVELTVASVMMKVS